MKKIISIILFLGNCFNSNGQFSTANLNSETVTKGLTVFTQDNSDNFIFTGQFLNTLTIDGVTMTNNYPDNGGLFGIGNNSFIAKRKPDGNFDWIKKFNLNALTFRTGCSVQRSGAMINGICTDANDNIYITGLFIGSLNIDGFNITSLTFKNGSCTGYWYDIFTAKISSTGTVLWVRVEGTNSIYNESANSITTDAAGNVVVTGTLFQSAVNGSISCPSGSWGGNGATAKMYFYVVKYNQNGTKIWEKKFAGNSADCSRKLEGKSVVSDGNNYYLTGSILGTTTFGSFSLNSPGITGTALVKLDANGNVVWARSFTGPENNAYSLLIGNGGLDLYIAGFHHTGTISFGNGQSLTSAVDYSGYLTRFSASTGNCQWTTSSGSYTSTRTGHRLFLFPNQNIGTPSRDAYGNFAINEYSSLSGTLINSTVATNTITGTPVFISDIIGTSNGYAYATNLRGGYELGTTSILSTQATNSNFSDLMLVQNVMVGFRKSSTFKNNPVQLNCYPNPVTDFITLQVNEDAAIGKIKIIDQSGRIVYHEIILSRNAQIDMQNLSAGIYILKSENCSFRIIKN